MVTADSLSLYPAPAAECGLLLAALAGIGFKPSCSVQRCVQCTAATLLCVVCMNMAPVDFMTGCSLTETSRVVVVVGGPLAQLEEQLAGSTCSGVRMMSASRHCYFISSPH